MNMGAAAPGQETRPQNTVTQHILSEHPYRDQLLADPDFLWRRSVPHLHRVTQDRRFRRRYYADPNTRELAERLAAAEREVRELRRGGAHV